MHVQSQPDTIATTHFKIKTEIFEGPLDLLLSLVEKRKLFINDISLARVTDEYISHISNMPEYSLSDRAQFIAIASTLLLIKAKSLLPTISLTEDEKGNIDDLHIRLKELELMRKVSIELKNMFGKKSLFMQVNAQARQAIFAPSKDLSTESLTDAIARVIQGLPKKQTVPQVRVKKSVSLEEMMIRLADRIQSAVRMSFKEFSKTGKAEKVEVVVSFLAMLELVKQGIIDANQDGLFNEIQMESHHIGVPQYK